MYARSCCQAITFLLLLCQGSEDAFVSPSGAESVYTTAINSAPSPVSVWLRDLTQEGVEPNPGDSKYDDEEIAHIDIYSADGSERLGDYTAPKTVQEVYELLEDSGALAEHSPAPGKAWNLLWHGKRVLVWVDTVQAGKYKIMAGRRHGQAVLNTQARGNTRL